MLPVANGLQPQHAKLLEFLEACWKPFKLIVLAKKRQGATVTKYLAKCLVYSAERPAWTKKGWMNQNFLTTSSIPHHKFVHPARLVTRAAPLVTGYFHLPQGSWSQHGSFSLHAAHDKANMSGTVATDFVS